MTVLEKFVKDLAAKRLLGWIADNAPDRYVELASMPIFQATLKAAEIALHLHKKDAARAQKEWTTLWSFGQHVWTPGHSTSWTPPKPKPFVKLDFRYFKDVVAFQIDDQRGIERGLFAQRFGDVLIVSDKQPGWSPKRSTLFLRGTTTSQDNAIVTCPRDDFAKIQDALLELNK